MSNLYDQYSSEIYYETTLEDARPNEVRAIFISYDTSDAISLNYPELRYLSYCHAKPDWAGLPGLEKLEHFSCEHGYTWPPNPLVELLGNSCGLLELEISNTPLWEDNLAGIERFKRLRSLVLSDNQLPVSPKFSVFPKGICQLVELEELTITEASIETLPEEMAQLGNLRKLSLACCGLTAFPAVFGKLSALEELDISGNSLGELPESIGQMTNLRELNITNCGLSTLPESLAALPKLKSVQATGNTFTQLPAGLKKLKSKFVAELKYRALYDEAAREKLRQLGTKAAIFKDFGFKLMVVEKLMYQEMLLRPAFDINAFAQSYTARKIDPQGEEAYEVIPEVRDYFLNLEIPMALLEDIDALEADGGDDIYAQLAPLWGGEADFFNVKSAADAKLLPNLKQISSPFLSPKAIAQLEKRGIEVD